MADVSRGRLSGLLRRLSTASAPLGVAPVEALTDAWSIIDTVNRFRELLRSCPGLKHNAIYELFIRNTAIVEELRDSIQHLNNRELQQVANAALAPLGTITWIAGAALCGGRSTGFTLEAGSRYPGLTTYGPVFDLERVPLDDQLHDIRLALTEKSASLDDLVARVASMIRSLEPNLRTFSEGKPLLGSDQLTGFALEPVQDETSTTPKSE